MDFDLTSDQLLLKDSIEKLLAPHYGDFGKRKTYQAQPNGFDPAIWREYAEAGILALPFPEAQGGFGGGAIERMIVMEAFGTSLALEPYLTSTLLCGEILRHSGNEAVIAETIPELAEGRKILAFAQTEPGARYDLHDIALAARQDGADYILEGEKSVVIGGGAADAFIVSARTAGNRRDKDGITLFLVDAKTPGISHRAYPTQDGSWAAEISFAQARVPASRILGALGEGLPLLTRGVDTAIAGLCAEAVGAMDALIKLTVGYLKTRKQFGVAISSFQALQHRTVDMLVMLEQARSMAIYAALSDDAPEPSRHAAIAAAKVQIGRSARFIGQQAIQLHGGIGMTMEYQSGHYFKRLTMIEQQFGDADHHLRSLAASGAALVA
jgi:pimeloyl-CoA dehydrogenase small subunit